MLETHLIRLEIGRLLGLHPERLLAGGADDTFEIRETGCGILVP